MPAFLLSGIKKMNPKSQIQGQIKKLVEKDEKLLMEIRSYLPQLWLVVAFRIFALIVAIILLQSDQSLHRCYPWAVKASGDNPQVREIIVVQFDKSI
jgi:hypothetical protein